MTQASKPLLKRPIGDDTAYFLPMAAFLLLTYAAAHWPSFFVPGYIIKTIVAGWLLIVLRSHYTKINWDYAWLGVIVGIIGIVQWVGMEKVLLHFWPHYWRPSVEVVNPFEQTSSPILLWSFIAVRIAGPVLVVPFMEEYFWRDFLWRMIIAPNDFKLANIGEWDWKAFTIVTLAFASVHIQWITAIVWGAIIAWMLVRTKSLGACIIAHAVTNLLLGVYVLYTHDWAFW